jgi:hypothetical protein
MERKRHQKLDIIANNKLIKLKLKSRIDELDLSYNSIIAEAKKHNIKGITKSSLSVYFNNIDSLHGSLTQKSVVYLCLRYGINLQITVSTSEYNEEECLKKLNERL